MTRERQHDSRTRRDSLTDVIHAEPETFWGAYRKKLGEQPALFDAGEHGEPLPIVPDTSNPSLKAVPIAAHKPLVEAEILEVMRKVFKLGVHLARGPSDFF